MPHASPCTPHECPMHTLFTPVHAFCRAHARPVHRSCRPSACPIPCMPRACPMHSPCTLCEHLVHIRCMPHAQHVHNQCTPCKPLHTPHACLVQALCMPCASKGWSSTFPKVVTYHLNDGHPHPKYGLPPRKDGNQACKGRSSTILRMIIHHPLDCHPPSQG